MNARSEMKKRHELEEFLKTKKTDTVSLLEDEKTCPLSPNEDHDKYMEVDVVTSDVQAKSTDPRDDNARIKTKEDDFRSRRNNLVRGFAADKARMKSEDEGVRGHRHTLQTSQGLTYQQRLKLKVEEGSTKSCNKKSESSVRSSSSSTVESSIHNKARVRSHRLSLQPSHELAYQQRMKLKMDEKSSARSSLSKSSSTMKSSTADKTRMKSEGGGVRGHRHSSLPSHELTFDQRLKIKMDEGGTKLYSNKTESSVRSSHRERSVSNGKKTENRVPDRKETVDDTDHYYYHHHRT